MEFKIGDRVGIRHTEITGVIVKELRPKVFVIKNDKNDKEETYETYWMYFIGECNCGAKHTSNPNWHYHFCDLNRRGS